MEKNPKFLVDHGFDEDDVDGIIKALSDKATTVGRQPVSRVDDIYTCKKSLTCDAKVTQLIELQDGRICSASNDRNLYVWNANRSRDLVLSGHKSGVVAVCQLVDGVICSSTGGDRTIRAWNVLNGKSYMVIAVGIPVLRLL